MITQAQFPDEQSIEGAFIRQPDVFQSWVTANGNSGYQAASGRYHLYVSWACPWAHRTIIVRKLKKLEHVIGMTVVDPIRDERGWAFREGPGHSRDPINGFQFLSQAYKATDPNYRGRTKPPASSFTFMRAEEALQQVEAGGRGADRSRGDRGRRVRRGT